MSAVFGIVGTMDGWKKGDLPGNQRVNVVINKRSEIRDGCISITPELASDDEVDSAIDGLIKDLESVRRQAKANIKKSMKILEGRVEVIA